MKIHQVIHHIMNLITGYYCSIRPNVKIEYNQELYSYLEHYIVDYYANPKFGYWDIDYPIYSLDTPYASINIEQPVSEEQLIMFVNKTLIDLKDLHRENAFYISINYCAFDGCDLDQSWIMKIMGSYLN